VRMRVLGQTASIIYGVLLGETTGMERNGLLDQEVKSGNQDSGVSLHGFIW
jgi:hypothetical protein